MTQAMQQTTSLNWKGYPIERAQLKSKIADKNKAGRPSGLRRLTQQLSQSKILVHECVRVFESQSGQDKF